jgi:hypothetical protein
MVFFCERAAGFAREFGFQEETYMDALVRMFAQALKLGVRHGSMRQPAAVEAAATGGEILGQDARR